jgi:hypothetical protein
MTDVQVGREIRSEFGWLWARTKRLADMLILPSVLAGAMELVEAMDRYADLNEIPQGSLTIGDAKFMRGLQYVEFPLEHS